MVKKLFVPARIFKSNKRDLWYITFHQVNPLTGIRQEFRRSFDLNRIKDLKDRARHAAIIKEKLNKEWLPAGYPFEDLLVEQSKIFSMKDALEHALNIKRELPSKKSVITFESKARILTAYLVHTNKLEMDVREFSPLDARKFLNWYQKDRGVKNITYNAVMEKVRALFNEIKGLKMIDHNPFAGIKKKVEEEKVRRTITRDEQKIILEYIKENNQPLYVAVLLQYFCFIRPIELRRIKAKDISMGKSNIKVHVMKGRKRTKQWKIRYATIPNQLRPVLSAFLKNIPADFYIFGIGGKPHPNKKIGDNTMGNWHRKALNHLKSKGLLIETDTIHFYSWKDTGVTNIAPHVVPFHLKDQLGHATMDMALTYYEQATINQSFIDLPINL